MTDPRALDVLALGRACVDEVLELDAYPPEDAKVPVLARLREGGGQASTAACLAAHLGGRAAFVGVLGDDEPGRFARARMEAFGVRLEFLPPSRGRTPLAWCWVSRTSGSRTIAYERGSGAPLGWEEVAGPAACAEVVLVDPQAEHLLPDLVPHCRRHGVRVVADAEHARPGWEATWGRVDVLAMGSSFLAEAFPGLPPEEALRQVAGRTRAACVATRGAGGALALLGGRVERFPAPAVPVRDTTGAGDAFHGALSLALARGAPLREAIRFAVAVASLCCRGLGGRSFPAPDEVRAAVPAGARRVLGGRAGR